MTAIIAGNQLGLSNGSLNVLGSQGALGQASQGRAGEQVYVNAATGNLVVQNRDEFVAGRGLDLSLLRTYNSQGLLDGDNNDNWRIGVYRKVYNLIGTVNTIGSTVTRVDADSAESVYTYDATLNKYVNHDGGGAYDTLTYASAAQVWTWTDGDTQVIESYDAADGGRITQVQDNAAGLVAQVQDASGETAYLDYAGNNLTDLRIIKSDGQTTIRTRYAYDANNRLIQIITDLSPQDASIADGNTYTVYYTYDGASRRVASMSQSDGMSLSFTYVQVGADYRVASITDALGQVTVFTYDIAARATTVTDPLGLATVFTYDAAGQLTSIADPTIERSANADQTTLVSNETQTNSIIGNLNTALLQTTDTATYGLNASLLQTTDAVPYSLNSSLLKTTDTVSYNLNSAALMPAGWGNTVPLESAGTSTDRPIVGLDGAGNGVAVWTNNGMVYARSYVNNVWQSQVTLGVLGTGANVPPNLYVDASGNAIAAWTWVQVGSPAHAYVARYINGVWQPAELVSASVGIDTSPPSIMINANGLAIVSFLSASLQQLYANYYNGTAWSGPTLLITSSLVDATTTPIREAAIDAAGNAIVVWSQVAGTQGTYAKKYRPGSGWSATAVMIGSGNTNIAQVGLDQAGNATIVWRDTAIGGGFYARRWSATGALGAIVGMGGNNLFFDLYVDPSGNAIVSFNSSGKVMAKRYVNGIWQATETIIACASTLPKAAINASGQAVLGWIDTSSGTVQTSRYTPGIGWSSVVNINSAANVYLPLVSIDGKGNIAVIWTGPSGVSARVYTAAPYYTVAPGDSWSSIAAALYGSASLGSKLQTTLGNPTLTAGKQLTGLPATLTDTVTVAPYYQVQAGDTWSSMANYLYGSVNVADELQVTLNNPTLSAGLHLTGLPTVLNDTMPVPPYYVVKMGDTWSSIAAYLYGSTHVADELQTALGNPALTVGLHLTGIPGTLTDTFTVAPYYQVQSGDTWSSIAAYLYGTAAVAGELQAAFGNPALIPGTRLSSPPVSLTHTWTAPVPPYYIVKSDDTWTTIARTVYNIADPDGVAALQAAAGNPALVAGLHLTLPATLSYSISIIRARYAYDANGNVTSVTDARGNVVAYEYDASGNRTLERDAAGNTVTRVFGAKNELLAETAYLVADPDGAGAAQPGAPLTARYVYDTNDHRRFTVSAEGRVTEYRYNAFGRRIAAIQYTAARYDVSALNPASSLSEADLTAWLPIDRSASIRVDTTYDFRGQVASTTSYTTVDAAGNGVADGTEAVTRYVYDQAGNLLKTVDPRGAATADPNDYTTTYVYDGLGRLLSTVDALGRTTVTQYDDGNRKTTLTLANGLVTTSVYDAAGELISVMQSADSAALGETKYFYDADGRLRRTEDPTGVKTHVLYDKAGRKVAAIDGNGGLTEYRYDADGNVTRTTRYATPIGAANLAALIDSQGRPADVILAAIRPAPSADDRSTWSAYDVAGRSVKSVDEAGYVTQYFYDGAGRMTDTVQFAGAINTVLMSDRPSAADINPISSPLDRLTRNFYDADGKLRGTLDGEGYMVEYQYDAAAQLSETIAYATATDPALRTSGTLAQLLPAAGAQDIHSYTLHNARGQIAATVDGEGYLTETVYDPAGNKTQVIRYATRVNYTAGATLARLRPAASAQDQVTSYIYSALDQLASATAVDGTVTQYSYDETGNLITTIKAANTSDVRTLNAQYDKQGRLTAALSGNGAALLNGNQTQAEIDAIWAAYGVKHTYDAAGRRTSITDAAGNKTLFFYNADGQLTHTISALGEVEESVYNALGQLTQTIQYGTRLSAAALAGLSGGLVNDALTAALAGIQNPALDSKISYAYDLAGNLRQTSDALGNTVTGAFDAFGDRVSQSQALGDGQTLDHTYRYDRRGLLIQTVWDPAGINTASTTVYDAFGRAIQTTDANGNVHTQSYDKRGRVVAIADPLNHARTITYDAFDRVLAQTDALGKATTYRYDIANRAMTVTTPEGIATTTVKNRHGDTVSVTDGRGNTTNYSYDKDGNLLTVIDALGRTAGNSYDNADRKIDSTDANGVKTLYTYDAAGRVLTRTLDPGQLNLVTAYAYDAKGQTVSVTDASGVITQTQFDLKGQVASVIVDAGAGRLNLTTAYTYDARGNKLTVAEGAGGAAPRVTRYTYDKLDRLVKMQVDPNGVNATTAYAYDKNGNLSKKTDALGNSTRYAYDANDRLVYTIDALGGVRKNDYDADGRVTKVTAYANAISLAGLADAPAVGDIAACITASAADEAKNYVYDADGREIYCIDALGGVTQKTYDANGNVIQTIAYANFIAPGTALTQAAIAAALTPDADRDRVTATIYDAGDRAVFSRDALGYVTENVYDANGNTIQQIHYANAVGSTAFNTASAMRAALILSTQDQSTRTVYDRANRTVFTVDAAGYVKETQYDGVGQVRSTAVYANPITLAAGAPTSADVRAAIIAAPAQDQHMAFVYDAAGRLVGTTDALGYTETYTYDVLGNKKTFTNKRGDTWTYGYDALGQLLTITQPSENNAPGAVTRYVYDALGNRTDTIEAQGLPEERRTHTVYDALGRLIEQTTAYGAPEASTHRFSFDIFGNEIAYVDPRGVELAERDTDWALAERLRLGYSVADADGARAKRAAELSAAEQAALRALYITTQVFDRLNRKIGATDAMGNTTQTMYDAFGNVVKVIDPNGNAGYFYYDQRNALTLQIDSEGYATQSVFDATGNTIETIKYANRAQGTYSETVRPQILVPAGGALPPAYIMSNAAADQHTKAAYDALNRLIRSEDAEGHAELFGYNAASRDVNFHQDKNGNVYRYDYDAAGHKIAEYLPITSNELPVVNRFDYDATGNQIKKTQAAGLPEERVTHYVYDKNDRLIETVEPPVLVAQSTVPAQPGGFQVGAGGTVSLSFFGQARPPIGGTLVIIPTLNTYVDVTWPPVVGYGDGNIVVTWSNALGTFNTTVGSGAISARVLGPVVFYTDLGPSYTVTVTKQTSQGDLLLASQAGNYAWAVDANNNAAAPAQTTESTTFHFTGQASQATLRLAYWPASDSNNITELDLKSYTPGTFSGMAQGVLAGNYGYEAKVFDANGEVLNVVTGTFSVANGAAATTIQAQPLVTGVLQIPHTYKAYDAAGNVVRETDAAGNVTYHYYDANNRLVGTVNAERYLRRYFYDAVGNVIAERTYGDKIPDTVALAALPDPARIAGMDAANFRETDKRYNANNLLTETDTRTVLVYDRTSGLRNQALTAQRQYDRNGNLVVEVDANGGKTLSYYDKAGHKIAQVDALNCLTTWEVDANGNVLRQTRYATALSGAISATSDPAALAAQAAAANNPNDRVCVYVYDRLNREVQETTLGVNVATVNALNGSVSEQLTGIVVQKRYDALGNLLAQMQDSAETDYAYDALARRTQELSPRFTDFNGVTVRGSKTTVYDGVGNVIQVNENGGITSYEYDPHGNKTREIDPLGSPTRYYYDLNGNIAVKHARRTNPDGTAPAIDTLYSYDKLNRQISTTDAKNFSYYSRYNAYGEIVAKGLNGIDQEYYEYDKAGRLVKTNKDDGVDRAYLYDANGNETAKIQSAMQDTDLKSLTVDQIAILSAASVQRTESAYDARNQLTRTYQAPIDFTTDNVAIQEVWVDALNNPFIGGTLTPMAGGAASMSFSAQVRPPILFGIVPIPTQNSYVDVSWPPIVGYGDGNIRVVWSTNTGTFTSIVGSGATSTRVVGAVVFTNALTSYTVSVYKETPQGSLLITSTSGGYSWSGDFNTGGSFSAQSAVASVLHFTGMRSETQTLQFWLWPQSGAQPAAPVAVPRLNINGNVVNDHFVFDWSGYASGNYNYEIRTVDTFGKELDHVRGTLTLGSNPAVASKQVHQIQPLVTPGSPTISVIARAQSYDAFGDVVQEIDGRGNATNFVYDTRGALVQKIDPETNATLSNGLVTRVRPATRYYYDYLGRAVATQDANGNRNSQRYDAAGHLLTEYHADGGVKQYGYDALGNKRIADNEIGERTRYTYDAKKQLIRVDHPTDGNFANAARFDLYVYDEVGRRIRHTNALGASELTYYDDIGRVKQTTSFGGIATKYRYIFNAATGGTTFITLEGDGRTLQDTKDYFGRLLSHTDLGGHIFNYSYNKAGWLTQQVGDTNPAVAGNEQNIGFTYYQNGYLKEIIDNGANTRSKFEYDQNGNRTFEGYAQAASGSQVYYEWSHVQYDELNRAVSIHDPKYDLNYEYDAAGNRRHIYARYHDGLNNDVQTQDYWYAYDTMNRFVVTKGALADVAGNAIDVQTNPAARGSGSIVAGANGVQILYNAASQRKVANNERYNYGADGLLTEAYIDNILRARRSYDAVGNVANYQEFDTAGGVTRNVNYTYTGDSTVRTENDGSGVSTYTYDVTGNLLSINNPQSSGTTLTTTYSYEYWDTAKQSQVHIQASNQQAPGWKPGFSNFIYDVNGHLTQVSDMAANRHLSYKLDAHGLILQRNELIGSQSSRTQYYYYLNGAGIGDAGGFGQSRTDYAAVLAARGQDKNANTSQPISSADFDYNYMPINDRYPATTPGTFTVRTGDTLQSVALAVWGDSGLWYLIADANGLADNVSLIAGQNLVIPNVVANIHNNASTFKVYNPGELIGDVAPTLPDPPPRPEPDNNLCGRVITVIVVVFIAVVVSIVTTGYLSDYMSGWAASMLGAAAGSAASQVAAKELGARDKFSWKEVGTATLTEGLTYGIDTGSVVIDALLKETIAQEVRLATNQQDKFSWSALAAAPINIDSKAAGVSNTASTTGASVEGFAADFLAGIAKGAVSQGMAILINRRGSIEWGNIAANALGTALGNAIAADMPAVQDMRLRRMEQKRVAQAMAQGRAYQDYWRDKEGGPVSDSGITNTSSSARADSGQQTAPYDRLSMTREDLADSRVVGSETFVNYQNRGDIDPQTGVEVRPYVATPEPLSVEDHLPTDLGLPKRDSSRLQELKRRFGINITDVDIQQWAFKKSGETGGYYSAMDIYNAARIHISDIKDLRTYTDIDTVERYHGANYERGEQGGREVYTELVAPSQRAVDRDIYGWVLDQLNSDTGPLGQARATIFIENSEAVKALFGNSTSGGRKIFGDKSIPRAKVIEEPHFRPLSREELDAKFDRQERKNFLNGEAEREVVGPGGMQLRRYHGDDDANVSRHNGAYATDEEFSSMSEARQRLATPRVWENGKPGNTMTRESDVFLPEGTVIWRGLAAPQTDYFGEKWEGGGRQIYIEGKDGKIDPQWFGNTRRSFQR